MSETGEPRRRRRQIADGTAGDGGAQRTQSERDIPHAHTAQTERPQTQETEIPAIPAGAQEGAAARRRRAQRAEQPAEPEYERILRTPVSEDAQKRRVKTVSAGRLTRDEAMEKKAASREAAIEAAKEAAKGAAKEAGQAARIAGRAAKKTARRTAKAAKRAAGNLGAGMLLAWEEAVKPGAAALGERLLEAGQTVGEKIGSLGSGADKPGAQRRRRPGAPEGRRPDTQGSRRPGAQRSRRPGAWGMEDPDAVHRGKTPRGREDRLRIAAMILLSGVMIYSAVMLGGILLRSVRTSRLTDDLSRMKREAAIAAPEPESGEEGFLVFIPQEATAEPTAAPAHTPGPQAAAQATAAPTIAPEIVKSTIYHEVGGDALPEMEKLYNENRDLVAWIGIEEVLDLPVVYRNNEYYLYRDFYKKDSKAGTLFLDENHPFKERTQNLLLHGHNMKDGTMFGRLMQYEQDISYLKNHGFIDFDTLWKHEKYVIFAVLRVSLDVKSEDFFNYYSYPTFSSDAAFESYVTQLQLRSEYAIPVDVEPGDALLTLSTCLDDDRLVIVARKLRPGETKSQLRSAVRLATKQ